MVVGIAYTLDVRFSHQGRVCAGDLLTEPPMGNMNNYYGMDAGKFNLFMPWIFLFVLPMMWLGDKLMIDRGAPLPKEEEEQQEKADEE